MGYLDTVSKNDSEKAINKVLTAISSVNDQQLLDKIYNMTLDALKNSKNEVRWHYKFVTLF